MALPASRSDFQAWCLRDLGAPVIQINLDQTQIDDAIDDAMQFWSMYHESAQLRTYYKYQMTQPDMDNQYITLPPTILAVMQVINPNQIGGITASTSDNFFSFEYQFMATSVWDLVQFGDAAGYFAANQYLAEMDAMFSQKALSRFNYHEGKLYLDFSTTTSFAVGQWLVAEVQAMLDPTTVSSLWSDRWLRKLGSAYMKKKWGSNLRKFTNFQLPSGMVLNGQAIYESALEEIEEIEEQIKRHQPPVAFIVR